jgi:hypothetical protein
MSSTSNRYEDRYEVVTVSQDPEAYRIISEEYWYWVHEPDCDAKSDRGHVTFLRDDCIGDPRKWNDGHKQEDEITRPVGTNIFFPVYHVHICKGDPFPEEYGGGRCDTTNKCLQAAYYDLNQIRVKEGKPEIWARIKVDKDEPVELTENLNDHTVTLMPFIVKVGLNRLNREPNFHLNPGVHKGVARGTYILLKNFQKGDYILDFGGNANNFATHSIYKMHIE